MARTIILSLRRSSTSKRKPKSSTKNS